MFFSYKIRIKTSHKKYIIYSVGQNNKNNLNLTALKAWYMLNVQISPL